MARGWRGAGRAGETSEADSQALSSQDRSLAQAVAIAGAGLSGAVLLLGCGAVVASNRRLRCVLPALGASAQARTVMACRTFLGTAGAAALAGTLIPLFVMSVGIGTPASLGKVWTAPLIAVAISSVVPVVVFVVVPRHNRE